MPRMNQRRPIDGTVTSEVREYLNALRALVNATGLSDNAVAGEMGHSPGYLSKLLSGDQMVFDRALSLHAATCRLIGRAPISRHELVRLHYKAACSSPARYMKEHKRTAEKTGPAGKHLPVPSPRGDRQVPASSSATRSELFLADLLHQEGRETPQTLEILHAGADVLGPPEVADVMANLRHRGEEVLADDFAQIYGREQDKSDVIHAARDLLDPYGLPSMASRLLTAAMSRSRAGNAS
ncbi:hypothetical protein [Streptomyces qinglanensis]|uniref:hypothetical protein n=1 Tax=Streptomyces qinglanensis TaxID=943816 RepID=UPI003799B3D8